MMEPDRSVRFSAKVAVDDRVQEVEQRKGKIPCTLWLTPKELKEIAASVQARFDE